MNQNLALGINYYNGDDGYPEDIEKAIVYFKLALDEKCYAAAYYLGLCYDEGLSDDQTDHKLALEYMERADYNYVNDATEWLAYYYLCKGDIVKFVDYALDVKKYVKDNQQIMIKEINRWFNLIDTSNYIVIESAISLLEFWWKRIKDKSSDLCKTVAKHRNNLLRELSKVFETSVNDREKADAIYQFLNKYSGNFSFISDAISKVKYRNLLDDLHSASSLEELEDIKKELGQLKEPHYSSLLKNLSNKQNIIKLSDPNITPTTIFQMGYYYLSIKEDDYYLDKLITAIDRLIERFISEDEFEKAREVCNIYPSKNNHRWNLLLRIDDAEKNKKEQQAAKTREEEYERLKRICLSSDISQIDFNKCFDLGWSFGKDDDLCKIMVNANRHDILFDYVKDKYKDSFLRRIVVNLPKEFYADDILKIKNEIKRRNIQKLVHFSPIENRNSIAVHGLLSKIESARRNIEPVCTDENRYDGFNDHISISITNKNYKMMWKKIYDGIITNGFVIYYIDPRILYEHPEKVIYCDCNAAKGVAPEHLDFGYRGLIHMFSNDDGEIIPGNAPPDVQAEILFKGSIGKKYILGNFVDTSTVNYGKENSFYSFRR